MEESLQQLEERERALSRRRRQVHNRIEYLRGTGAHEPESRKILDELLAEERAISLERRELHAAIDRLRRATPPT